MEQWKRLLHSALSTLNSRPPILHSQTQNARGDVAELADALDLGSSSREGVQVQLLSSPVEAGSVEHGVFVFVSYSPLHAPRSPLLPEPVAQSVEQRTFNP